MMVVSSRLGNKSITRPSTDERPCIYVYLIDDDHYYAFFSCRYTVTSLQRLGVSNRALSFTVKLD